MFLYRAGHSDAVIAAEGQAITNLAEDLRRAGDGYLTDDCRWGAPVLRDWTVVMAPAPILVGRVSGHPLLPGEGRSIATSQLWLLSSDRRWARTRSRWYELANGVVPDAVSDGGFGRGR